MGSDFTIHSFVHRLSNGMNEKDILHFKALKYINSMYNSLTSYKNAIGASSLIIPSADLSDLSTNKISFKFQEKDVSNFTKFSECIKKNFTDVKIKLNEKSKTISVKAVGV